MTRVINGPAYRTFDPHKGRWVVGREACIDALVRKELTNMPRGAPMLPEPYLSEWRVKGLLKRVQAIWQRAVFR